MAAKRLTVSEKDKMVSGVCGGLAEYFDRDVTVIRLLTLLIILLTGIFPGLVAYLIAAVIMPRPGEN